MTLKHIKIFIAVCDTGSMTAAAKELFIAQPAVSFAIAEMEHYYGQKLFDRISNRLYLTEVGKALLARAKPIVSMFDSMEDEIREWGNGETLRLGGSISFGDYGLADIVRSLQKRTSGLNVQVQIQNSPTIEQMILDGVLDAALIEGPVLSKIITAQKVGESSLVFICPKDHPWAGGEIDVSQLNNQSFVGLDSDSMERRLLGRLLRSSRVKVTFAWQSMDPDTVIKAVMSGVGIAAVSNLSAADFLKRGELGAFQIQGNQFQRDIFVIYHPNKIITSTIQDFIDLCQQKLNP